MVSFSVNPGQGREKSGSSTVEDQVFDYLLDLEVKKAARYLYYFSVLVVQLDPMNGKAKGNGETQQTLGKLMQEELRDTDLLKKRKNDTFMAILQYTDLENARNVGQRILERVYHYVFDKNPGRSPQTVSIGVSCFPSNANDVSGIVQKAEEFLGIAKEKGGNTVCIPE